MIILLPPVIAAFFRATNTREFAVFLSLFTPNAHVNDEANDYYGSEIAAWIERATADTKPNADVIEVAGDGKQHVVTAAVSGNFPGSPVRLRYFFTLEDDTRRSHHQMNRIQLSPNHVLERPAQGITVGAPAASRPAPPLLPIHTGCASLRSR